MTDEKQETISKPDENEMNGKPGKKISERKRLTNRANAQKSTGPRTEQGKKYSRRNSLRHGLLSQTVLFGPYGKLVEPELLEVRETLCKVYGTEIRTQLQIDVAIIEYWRMQQAIAVEVDGSRRADPFLPTAWVLQLQRYTTASRNAFLKILDSLAEAKLTAKNAETGDAHPSDLPQDESEG